MEKLHAHSVAELVHIAVQLETGLVRALPTVTAPSADRSGLIESMRAAIQLMLRSMNPESDRACPKGHVGAHQLTVSPAAVLVG